ncbi:glycoside hydrolase family protein [Paraglaciecola aquimarina]|uniref:Glycoside hydrolase family protein n=1 Tax=Paraglaciecola aquimarina TaxID=1235557 RepID=A0ABU3STX7_9ALTE|nr:glycoside hydrolase family protein [Paraglaciecola aquimarina]MDU0353412.1 glycoside hydrolase family protein [Paraglaciecola aquimarina]
MAKNSEKDVVSYSLFRGDGHGKNQQKIADQIKQTHLTDFTPTKGTDNTYFVYAHDYSGNISLASKPIKARVKMVKGASFSDLILPMPITDALRTDLWGGDNVLPRDPNNGIEHPNWSYWGGRPVLGKDGKFHMVVTRWPANATKGHWEWPNSTVAYTVAKRPTGPYKVVKELAYDYKNGLGHNPDIILLNDGSYLLYSLVSWQPTLFHAQTMSGPWQCLGVMQVDKNTDLEIPARFYRFERNLSGVHLDNGQFLFVTKGGAMMLSESGDPLGPYKVLTAPIQHNPIIPEKYRGSNYEDPVIWKDEVQYHMIINAFLDYRAIYLRSPDGINWKFNSGTAYTPNDTIYEDGTKTHWYKLERPHVITDQYGRATHLSVAVVDVPKRDDLARDKHSSKNIIMPLTVPKRLTLLSEQSYQYSQKNIKVVIQSEPGFNAHADVNIASLRFGAAEEVDYGQGASVVKFEKQGKNLVVEFAKEGLGLTEQHFAGKLLGKTTSDELLIGFTRLPNFDFHPR